MTRTLVVHIGIGKAGSTAIQTHLLRNRDQLKQAKLRYWGLNLEHTKGKKPFAWQIPGGIGILQKMSPPQAREQLKSALLEAVETIPEGHQAIWSNESIYEHQDVYGTVTLVKALKYSTMIQGDTLLQVSSRFHPLKMISFHSKVCAASTRRRKHPSRYYFYSTIIILKDLQRPNGCKTYKRCSATTSAAPPRRSRAARRHHLCDPQRIQPAFAAGTLHRQPSAAPRPAWPDGGADDGHKLLISEFEKL